MYKRQNFRRESGRVADGRYSGQDIG